jgi:hypothetical protein
MAGSVSDLCVEPVFVVHSQYRIDEMHKLDVCHATQMPFTAKVTVNVRRPSFGLRIGVNRISEPRAFGESR